MAIAFQEDRLQNQAAFVLIQQTGSIPVMNKNEV
jgi:hypothetical protein